MRQAAPAAALIAGACGIGCGGVDLTGNDARGVDAAEPPERPTRAECERAAPLLPSRGTPPERPPRPGVYRFAVRGHTTRAGGEARRIPRTSEVIVTPARRAGALLCVRVQRRFGPEAVATALVAVRGGQAYTLSGEMMLRRQRVRLRPDRPVPSGDLDGLETSGSYTATIEGEDESARYSGPVVGSYATEVIGRRRMRVGDDVLRVVGVQVRQSFRGRDVEGRDLSIGWVALDERLVAAETVRQDRTVGGERSRISYTTRLLSTRPRPLREQ